MFNIQPTLINKSIHFRDVIEQNKLNFFYIENKANIYYGMQWCELVD